MYVVFPVERAKFALKLGLETLLEPFPNMSLRWVEIAFFPIAVADLAEQHFIG